MSKVLATLCGLLLLGLSHGVMAAPDAGAVACEGRFVNPITDICWRCMFPLSLGSAQVTGGTCRIRPTPPVRYKYARCPRRYSNASDWPSGFGSQWP